MPTTRLGQLPTREETEALDALQAQWVKWSSRRARYHVDRIELDRQRARIRFIEEPSPENEAELIRCADVTLLARQYATMREACDEALGGLAFRLRDVVAPMLRRLIDRLREDLREAEEAEAKERAAVEAAGRVFARSPKSRCTELSLAISRYRRCHDEVSAGTSDREPAAWLRDIAKW